MTELLTQARIERELSRLMEMLEEETEAFRDLAQKSAEAEAEVKSGWAKEYLAGVGSIRDREAYADYKMADAFKTHKIAEGLMKAKREKLLSLRTSIDALRTLNANVRVLTN